MNPLRVHSAINSRNQALVPGATLLDGRTEIDQLGFLSEYASLINFYDSNNQLNGSWHPFLLKDPVFLLASISRTQVAKLHTHFTTLCNDLQRALNHEVRALSVGYSFNQLFDHITALFLKIERWSYYMQRSPVDYKLRQFVISQTTSTFSVQLWAVLALREKLALSGTIKRIEAVNYFIFDSFDQLVWKQNKGKSPFWEILNLPDTETKRTPADFFNALRNVGNQLYDFLKTIVQNAPSAFRELDAKKSRYPDTTLIRTFVNLLEVHREQLNGIASRHLDFYYRDILKQSEKPAEPDAVFVCMELAGKTAAFSLPLQTAFSAGVDAAKNPVVFSTVTSSSLNPAVITNAYTIAVNSTTKDTEALYVQPVLNPGVVAKNEAGQVQSWGTLGGIPETGAVAQKLGFAFGSPLLLLQSGTRKINVTLNYTGEFSSSMFASARFYLSTQSAWLDVTGFVKQQALAIKTPLVFSIRLTADLPPIEAFLQNPDGVTCDWPMMKIELDTFSDLADPPTITGMDLKVFASGIKTLQLLNDSGALNPKAPFPLFGSTPLPGSRFIIGSSEIFSKPVDSLCIEMDWDKLPNDFNTYYQQYNAYIADPSVPVMYKKPGILRQLWTGLKKLGAAIQSVINFFLKRKPVPYRHVIREPFNNVCFSVDFSLLQDRAWQPFNMVKDKSIAVDPADPAQVKTIAYAKDPGCRLLDPAKGTQLFNTDGKDCILETSGFFSYAAPAGNAPAASGLSGTTNAASTIEEGKDLSTVDPGIQRTPLLFSPASSSGFLCISLRGPDFGFGSGIYSNVVSNVALKNAVLISSQDHDKKGKLFLPPNPPFVPKLKALNISQYSASASYDFAYKKEGYPVQCYHYTPFANYLVYDNTKEQQDYWPSIGASLLGGRRLSAGVALFPHFEFAGALVLGLDQVVFPAELNLYFELSRTYPKTSEAKKIAAYCLCDDYWQPMTIIADGTNNFSCSGIITVQLMKEMTTAHFSMPNGKCWLAFCTKDSPGSFPETAFLKTNGVKLKRSGSNFLADTNAPKLAEGVIVKTMRAVPQLSAIVQPFASFGGRAMENATRMNSRVSTSIKTKNRAVTATDISLLINEEFSNIYYTKVVVQKAGNGSKTALVYVVSSCSDAGAPGAFVPLVTECTETKIQNYLASRCSAFSNFSVANFDLNYVRISTSVSISDGYAAEEISKTILQSLNLFLSPWIASGTEQVEIDGEITSAQVNAFIKTIPGVENAGTTTFQVSQLNGSDREIMESGSDSITPGAGILFVSAMNHAINTDGIS